MVFVPDATVIFHIVVIKLTAPIQYQNALRNAKPQLVAIRSIENVLIHHLIMKFDLLI